MRVELVELLSTRKICHPSRFTQLVSDCDAGLRIEVTGYPWWAESAPPTTDASIKLHFEVISDGAFDFSIFEANSSDEDLEFFDVQPLSSLEWARGPHCEVFCTGQLSAPMDVYASLHDFLISADCFHAPMHYLNAGQSGSLSEFLTIASSSSFLFCRGPEAVCQIVCTALERQGAKFNIVKGTFQSEGIWVRLGDSQFICGHAYAVFQD